METRENPTHIINILRYLRDDLKTWVTNNFTNLRTTLQSQDEQLAQDLEDAVNQLLNGETFYTTFKRVGNAINNISKRVNDMKAGTDWNTFAIIDTLIRELQTKVSTIEVYINNLNTYLNFDESTNSFNIIDNYENIIFKVDANGVSTTNVNTSDITFSNGKKMSVDGVFVTDIEEIEIEI